MVNDILTVQRIVTVIALDGRTEADLLALIASAPELARLEGLDEAAASGISGVLDGHVVAIGNGAYFSALGLPTERLCDWPDRIRRHGQRVLFVAIDGRVIGFVGVGDAGNV